MVAHAFNPSSETVFQQQLGLHRPCLKKERKKERKEGRKKGKKKEEKEIEEEEKERERMRKRKERKEKESKLQSPKPIDVSVSFHLGHITEYHQLGRFEITKFLMFLWKR